MAGSQISTSVTILDSLHGFQAVSLTEYSTSAAAAIAAGSVVEIAGAFFTFDSDEAIEASTWTAIVTGNSAYITLTASGTAGSQIVVAAYTSTAPTWRDDFQGWYASAASSVRIIGRVYKAEATNYAKKYLLNSKQDLNTDYITSNGYPLIPYRVTTESFYKALYTEYTVTQFTTISTVFTISGGYMYVSATATSFEPTGLILSTGSIFGVASFTGSSPTNATFIISYWY